MGKISPLFAVKADKLLEQGLIAEAISMIEEGLIVYPDYPAAKAVLAKAYQMNGESNKANEVISDAVESQPFSKTVIALKQQIDNDEIEVSNKDIQSKVPIQADSQNNSDDFSDNFLADETEILEIDTPESQNDDLFKSKDEIITDVKTSNDEISIQDISNSSNIIKDENNIEEFISDSLILDESEIINNSQDIALTEPQGDIISESIIENNIDISESIIETEDSNNIPEIDLTNESENRFEKTDIDEIIKDLKIDISPKSLINFMDKNPDFSSTKSNSYLFLPREMNLFDNLLIEVNNDSILDFELNFNNNTSLNEPQNDFFNLAKKLENVKINPVIEQTKTVKAGKAPIVTETIANIYIMQGAINEAIDAFRILMDKNPDKAEYYQNKINELNNK